jgi:hypothetical protein
MVLEAMLDCQRNGLGIGLAGLDPYGFDWPISSSVRLSRLMKLLIH